MQNIINKTNHSPEELALVAEHALNVIVNDQESTQAFESQEYGLNLHLEDKSLKTDRGDKNADELISPRAVERSATDGNNLVVTVWLIL